MRRAPPRRRRAPHISLPRSAPRRRTKPGAFHRRGAARGRGSTAPADGAAAAADESMRARRWEGRPTAASLSYRRCSNYFAARLPGLDSRRAAACFSSSSPVGAIFACRLLRVLLAASESGWILRGGLVVGPGSCCTPTVARENQQQQSSPRETSPGSRSEGPRATSSPVHRRRARCLSSQLRVPDESTRDIRLVAPTKNHPLLRRSRTRTRSASSRRPRPR